MLIQQTQGWGKPFSSSHLIHRLVRNSVGHHINARVLALQRTNYIAHSMAASNTEVVVHQDNTMQHHLDLDQISRKYTEIRDRY